MRWNRCGGWLHGVCATSPTTEFVAWSGYKWPPLLGSPCWSTPRARLDCSLIIPPNWRMWHGPDWQTIRPMRRYGPTCLLTLPADRSSGQEHDDDVGKIEESQVHCQAGRRLRDKTQ